MKRTPQIQSGFRAVLLVCSILPFGAHLANAQIHGSVVRDNTLDPASRGLILSPPPGPGGPPSPLDIQIPASIGEQHAHNLFQSFSQFNLTMFDTATFTGPKSIRNIFVRVTGGQPVFIDGKLQSTIPNASFFLMDPQGVIYGPDAVLDVKGSFAVTTADVIKLRNGGSFNAISPRRSVLTTAPPVAFGFLRKNPAAIDAEGEEGSDGTLVVPANKNLSFVGGDIQAGFLALGAPGGQLSFVSVKKPQDVPMNSGGPIPQPQIAHPGAKGGTVTLTGLNGLIEAGEIYIRANTYVQEHITLTINQTAGNTAGGIDVEASEVELNDASALDITSATAKLTDEGGNISIRADDFSAVNFCQVFTTVTGPGTGGNLAINVNHTFHLDDASIFVGSSNVKRGRGGALSITADQVQIADSSSINAETDSPANGGSISITTRAFSMVDSADVSGSTTSSGNGGDVSIRADTFLLTGATSVFAESSGTGTGGKVDVNARKIAIVNEFGAGINASSNGPGPAGDVSIHARSLTIQAGSITSSALSTGAGGSVGVTTNKLTLTDNSDILANSTLQPNGGAAGSVAIDAKALSLNASLISSSTNGQAEGGSVVINAPTLLAVDSSGPNFGITAGSEDTADGGRAGDVRVNSNVITLKRSDISSTTAGQGAGGTVAIDTGRLTVHGDGANHSTGVLVNSTLNAIGAGNAGEISVRGDAVVLTAGGQIASGGLGDGDGGVVAVNTNHLRIDGPGSAILTDAGTAQIPALAGGQGGQINVTGQTLQLSHAGRISSANFGAATGGNVAIHGDVVNVIDGGLLDVNTAGSAEGGTLTVASRILNVSGSGSSIAASTGTGGGKGGDLFFNVGTLQVLDGGQINASTAGSGHGGTLALDGNAVFVTGRNALITADAAGSGEGGDLTLDSPNVQILHGGAIDASTNGSGDGGNALIEGGSLAISGNGSILRAETNAAVGGGRGGNVTIADADLRIAAGGRIDASTNGSGNGGSVQANLGNALNINGAGVAGTGIASDTGATFSPGHGGDVILAAPVIRLNTGATVSANGLGTGHAGSITITTPDLDLFDSKLSVQARKDGGSINLLSRQHIILFESEIDAQGARIGNINIDPSLTVLFASHILTTDSALSETNTGNITLNTEQLIKSADSTITAVGVVVVKVVNPSTDVVSSLARLPSEFENGALTLQPQCGQAIDASTFLLQGRGSVSDQPGAFQIDLGANPFLP